MPVSPFTRTLIDSTLLNALSNVLAQIISQYGDNKPFHLNILALVQYLSYNTITIPPNFWWQRYLEIRYPGSLRRISPLTGSSSGSAAADAAAAAATKQANILPVVEIKEKPQPVTTATTAVSATSPAVTTRWLGMSPGTRNFIAKFLLDQSVGSVVNILLFIVLINLLQGSGWDVVWEAVCQDFGPIMSARLMYRPVVSTLMYTLVPVDRRVVFGSACGVIWGVYLSLYAAV